MSLLTRVCCELSSEAGVGELGWAMGWRVSGAVHRGSPWVGGVTSSDGGGFVGVHVGCSS